MEYPSAGDSSERTDQNEEEYQQPRVSEEGGRGRGGRERESERGEGRESVRESVREGGEE